MQRIILSIVVLLAVLPVYLEAARKQRQCSQWTFGDCVPTIGDCGKGKKAGTRSGENCQVTQKDFKCRVPCPSCKYEKPEGAEWSACDVTNNKMSVEGTLNEGSSASCPATKTLLKRCRSNSGARCRYTKGTWSECNASTREKTRVDNLAENSPSSCEATRTKTKRCRPGNL